MFASYNGQARPRQQVASRRKVFANAMVAHVWAQQTHSGGRSANGNFYFEGATIYSYGSHFPIAHFTNATSENEQRVVLFNNETRSVSTSGHQRYTRAALDGLPVRVFNVPCVDDYPQGHTRNMAHYREAFEAQAASLAKPHVKNWHTDRDSETYTDLPVADVINRRIDALHGSLREMQRYCEVFKLECEFPDIYAAQTKIRDAFARYHDPKRVAKRAASASTKGARHWRQASIACAFIEGVTDQKPNLHFVPFNVKHDISAHPALSGCNVEYRIEQIERQRANAQRSRSDKRITANEWRDGKPGVIDSNGFNLPTMIRRVGDTLQTSRDAECPFSHAVVAFLKAQQCRMTSTTWHRNGQQIRVGHFSVDSIDAQGNMIAGCHTLEWSEMLRLAIREVPHLVKPSFGLPAVSHA